MFFSPVIFNWKNINSYLRRLKFLSLENLNKIHRNIYDFKFFFKFKFNKLNFQLNLIAPRS